MKVQYLLTLDRHEIKTEGRKITGIIYKNNKKFKFSVDKKLYNEALKIKNQQTIKNNETIKLNNEMIKIMKSHKLMNKELQHAKNVYQQTINDEPKLNMVPLLNNVAFKHALETFIVNPLESNKYNYERFYG